MMTLTDVKAIAAGCFPDYINQATEWVIMPEPKCEVETSKGEKFNVIAQKYGSPKLFFCGDYYSTPNVCFVYLGDLVDEVPNSKGGFNG